MWKAIQKEERQMGGGKATVTFTVGDVVPLPSAPDGVGQVEDLLRSNVVVLYARHGQLCRAKVRASELARLCDERPLLLASPNLFGRGVVRRSKTFARQQAPGRRPGRRSA